MTLIHGADFWLGRFTEDEIHGEAFAEMQRIFLEWKRPTPPWPAGTTFTEPRKERQWASTTSWAILPGVRYELLVGNLREGEPDPREVPPVIWSLMLEPNGTIYACPRIAQMAVTLDPPHPVDDERKLAAYAGGPLGLEPRYRVGHLSRGLREEVRQVSDGWGYSAPHKSESAPPKGTGT